MKHSISRDEAQKRFPLLWAKVTQDNKYAYSWDSFVEIGVATWYCPLQAPSTAAALKAFASFVDVIRYDVTKYEHTVSFEHDRIEVSLHMLEAHLETLERQLVLGAVETDDEVAEHTAILDDEGRCTVCGGSADSEWHS